MVLFLMLMGLGLAGLAFMALPGLGKHGKGHAHVARGHAVHHGTHVHHVGRFRFGRSQSLNLIPEPRAILSLTALYGAFGYLLEAGFHLTHRHALLAALVPALLCEWAIVAPLWRLALKFEGKESSPLDWLLAEEAIAVTGFANGRGIVRVTHDGRVVQLAARLVSEHAGEPVRVGDRLRIEDVDAATERVTVSLHPFPLTRTEK
jgi:hypothetical protein